MKYINSVVYLAQGSVRFTSDEIHFPESFEYGKNEDFLKVFVLAYLKLLDDSPLQATRPRAVYVKFLKTLTTTNLPELVARYSDLLNALLETERVTGGLPSTGDLYPLFFKTPVFREFMEWDKVRDPALLKYVISFLRFGKKLKMDTDLGAPAALRDWYRIEEKLSALRFDKNSPFLISLRNIVRALVPDLDNTYLLPKFGSGRVAERGLATVYDKLERLEVHYRLAHAFLTPNVFRDAGETVCPIGALGITRVDKRERYSRFKAIFKYLGKSRTIMMEPNDFMYFQQEVKRWAYTAMSEGLISRFVRLDDQSRNREWALHGSTYYSVDTIDLSSASDSVHVDLVRSIFPRQWLYYLLATRSSLAEMPDGKVVRMNKFAPMGSALCFPVQCIVFTAVCMYAYMQKYFGESTGERIFTERDLKELIQKGLHRGVSASTPFTKRMEPPVVFGDDIITDHSVTSSVISLLSSLGFSVNSDKSFTGSQSFRESCGVFAFDGDDVTPFIFQLPFFKRGRMEPQVYAALISSVNNAGDLGFHQVATFLLSILRSARGKLPLPFSANRNDFALYTKQARRNASRADAVSYRPTFDKSGKETSRWPNADWVWHEDYQVLYQRVQGIGSRRINGREPLLIDSYRLTQWWRKCVRGLSLIHI